MHASNPGRALSRHGLFFAIIAILFGTSAHAGRALAQDLAKPKPATGAREAEKPVNFVPAKPDPLMGDWQGKGDYVAQVFPLGKGQYQANVLTKFDAENNVIATVKGSRSADGSVHLRGGEWSGSIKDGFLTLGKGTETLRLTKAERKPPSLGARPPEGAVVLFDGRDLHAWAKKKGKEWLAEDGAAKWKLLPGGAVEVVPGADCIITHEQFGDCKLHVEFRTLGAPTNSGVYLQCRYEVNINETYGRLDLSPNAGFDNCTRDARPRIRPCRPPLEWQTLDIEFHAPRFDAQGNKIAKARATVLFNGVKIYADQELERPRGAANRLGEGPTGPLMLQEHGMPVQFRNIWLVKLEPTKKSATAPAQGFRHPGVLLNRDQLDWIKKQVAARAEPQFTAFELAKGSELGARSYTPWPHAVIECGPRSNPDHGCKVEQRDSQAAYTQALLWYITEDKTYAENAIKIMNAWSITLTGGHKLANGPVQAAWCGSIWPRAAEIIRYTYPGWAEADRARFERMLATQYLPSLINGSCENGNKELAMSEAIINIGVFNDDRKTFDLGLAMWRGRAPAYIYLKSDGPTPVKPAHCNMAIWTNKGQGTPLVDGLLQESVRDSGHANMGLSSMVNAAETARQQGIDLYAEQGKRIMAALEFQAQYLAPNHAHLPPNLTFHKHPTWEIAYNHYHNRLGFNLPKMKAVLQSMRPTAVNHHMVWETLTHAETGAVGLPPLMMTDK